MTVLRRVGVAAVLTLTALVSGAAAHPTPKVVLMKHADFIRQTIPAKGYFVRTVTIGKADLAAIRKASDYTPDDPDVQFFLGQDADSKTTGVALFQQLDTPHGPIEVGITFGPDGAIANAAVTTATVETKPWVQEAVAGGLMKHFTGMKEGDDPRKALQSLDGKLGGMPEYMCELIATAVGRGMVVYGTLYKESAT